MRTGILISAAVGFLGGACGGDGTFSGTGSKTLLVTAELDNSEGGVSASVRVRRAGNDVPDATVTIASDLGEAALVHGGDGVFRGTQAGWRGSYTLHVSAGPKGVDHLEGGIGAPESPVLKAPLPGIAFDPHLAPHGVIEVTWAGQHADLIRVRTKDYDPGFVNDEGSVLVSNTYFVDSSQDIHLERQNMIDLAGGAAGSTLSAHIDTQAKLSVTNPF